MEYIIDGNNLIKSSSLGKDEQNSRDSLIILLLDYRRKHPSIRFTVVFDGFPSPMKTQTDRGIKVLFSGDATADEIIRERVEKSMDNNHLKTIVSNDRGVQDCGRLFGAKMANVNEFLTIISPRPLKERKRRTSPIQEENINRLTIERELKSFYKNKL